MAQLTVVTSKKEDLFTQIQDIYELALKISDKTIQQKPMIKSSSVKRLRKDFSDMLDLLNEFSLKEDADFTPNYAPKVQLLIW